MRQNEISIQEYGRIHYWLRQNYGKANKCDNPKCLGKSKNFGWALKPDRVYEFNRDNFSSLCKSCHAIQDFTEDGKKRLSEFHKKYSPNIKPIKCSLCKVAIKKPRNLQKYCAKCRKVVDRKLKNKWWVKNKEYKNEYYLKNREKYLKIFKDRYYAKLKH